MEHKSKKIKIKPDIVFKDDSAFWKNHKIGDILTEMSRQISLEDNKDYQLVTVKRRNEGVVSRGRLKGKDILVKNYFEVKEGDYIISKRQVVHGANGIVPKSLHNAVVSNEYLIASSNGNITTEYWTLISMLPQLHKMFFLSSYGVDIEKLVFDVNDWKKRTIIIPEINQQNRITEFFKTLDELIKQYQQKHNKLKVLKKAMLSKMFPQQGQTVPEIRFKGFVGDWEEKKLSKISTYHSSTLSVGAALANGKYKLYDANDVIGYSNDNGQPCDYITIIKDGSGVGRIRLLPKNTSFIATMGAIRPLESDINFLFCCLLNTDFSKYIFGATIPHIYYSSYGEKKYFIPSKEEQKIIGDYFKNIDHLISNHELQISKLQNIKKAFLAKMFI